MISRAVAAALLLALHPSIPLAADRLADAVKQHDRAALRALLQTRGGVDAADAEGATALHWATYLEDLEAVDLLVRAGANPRAANRHGVTPLSLACINGNAAVIESLLRAGADPNTALSKGETPLMTAARTGKLDAVKVLLARGADCNASERWRRQTALMWAAAEGHRGVVEALLEHGADLRARSSAGFTPLLFAVREGRIDAARALLRAGADVNDMLPETREQALRRAGINPKSDAKIEQKKMSALLLAVENAHYELATALLDAGADPNSATMGWTALHQLSWVRKPGTGNNKPAPPGSGNMTSLEFVRVLVARGANVNARMTRRPALTKIFQGDLNYIGATPFLMAARTGDAELMRTLVSLGADPRLPNEDNTTPFLVAAGVGTHNAGEDTGTESEMLEALKLALELGGDVNAVDDNRETAMHGAAYSQFPGVARFLAEHGARPAVWNQKNKSGWTPSMIALGVQRGNNIQSSQETAAAIRDLLSGAVSAANEHGK
jgi:ankyrin repeat protein